ncbi:hypothetical protein BOTBODRAFT_178869 [Botryobasidium botryosum FD-172 SS1]|uniref:Uncharacterized protein n=1 Tax=Botryobasidium botryosum (strain FD-172 SS1) TaxID=930990 RepID=A0A067MDI0_BOTB1|nr:hypothetical protein BOTBODRAFT_178869 [Botryobasidium botryosum FD-172 SS1]
MINEGTWHDGLQAVTDNVPLAASFTFAGTGVYVFGILPPAGPTSTRTSLDFALDGVANGTYLGVSEVNATDFQYKVNFFAVQGLANQSHTLTITCSPPSFVMLDFFVYTYLTPPDSPPPPPGHGGPHGPHHPPPPPPPPPSQPTGGGINLAAPVGGAVGGTLGVVVLAGLAYWLFQRNKRSQQQQLQQRQQPSEASRSPRFADMSMYANEQTATPWTNPSSHTPTTLTLGGFAPSNSSPHQSPSSPPSHHSPPPGAQISRFSSVRSENPPPPVYEYHGP